MNKTELRERLGQNTLLDLCLYLHARISGALEEYDPDDEHKKNVIYTLSLALNLWDDPSSRFDNIVRELVKEVLDESIRGVVYGKD